MIRPLTGATLAFAAGLLLGLRTPTPATALLAFGAACAPLLPPRFRSRGILAIYALAGLALGGLAAGRAHDHCLVRLPDGARVEARGHLTAQPDAEGAAGLELSGIRIAGVAVACRGAVRAHAGGAGWRGADGGSEVAVWGRWLARPAEGPWPRRAERAGTLIVDSLHVTRPASPARHTGAVLRGRAQRRIRTIFARHAGLVEALILARRGGIDPEVRERFARAGLSHLLAISGLHVGVVAGTLLLLGRLARLGARATSLAAVGCTFAYVLFLGAPHAAARASLQLGLVVAMRRLQRPADPFSPLAAAALVLLVADPLAILDPGFQLSFAGTAGIIALRRRLMAALPFGRFRLLQDGLATSIAATLATAPIAALHFGRLAAIGVIANLAAIPAVGAAVPAVGICLAAGAVRPEAGRFLAGGAELLLDAVEAIAAWAAAVPGGSVWVPRDAILAWALAAVAAAVVVGRVGRAGPRTGVAAARAGGGGARRGVRPAVRRLAGAATATSLLIAWPAATWRGGEPALEIHAIDVGQGDALAIRSPEGRWILVDAGPRSRGFDAGRARVVPFLLRHGVRRIEALVLTHPDADHIGGAPAVLDAIEVGTVVDPGFAAGKALYLDVLADARSRGIRWIAARTGREVRLDGLTLRFLYPDAASLDADAEANQVSVAFRLEYGGFRALFLGDLPAEAERRLVRGQPAALRAELLKVAHHGSGTSTTDALLAAAAPELAVISVGRHNRYGHPDPDVLRRLGRSGVRVLRTDRDGAIRVRVRANGGIEVSTAR